jgi:hypothetical protein
MDKQKSIEALQFFVTGLSEGAFVHKVQGQIFKAQGFTKLGEKYIGHYTEEMEWVEKFIDRILDQVPLCRPFAVSGSRHSNKKEGFGSPFLYHLI